MPSDVSSSTPSTRSLVGTIPFALLIGVLSAVTLLALSELAEALQHLVWDVAPQAWGLKAADGEVRWWWTVAVLTVTGLLIGAVIRWVPGHAGNDPLTTGLVAPPLHIMALPGLALALVLGLAGGVSLGPENPIIAINVALAAWLAARPSVARSSGMKGPTVVALGTAATVGALFATPIAAALILTATFAEQGSDGRPLFDRLFGPLVAGGAGALTMMLVGAPSFAVDLPAVERLEVIDLLSGALIALFAGLLASLGAIASSQAHRAFHRFGSPVIALGIGGLLLGVLGALGGEVTLFKGLDEMRELTKSVDERTWYGLVLIAVTKVIAIVVAAAAGFRGGRIFPAVFVGVAVGLAASSLVPSVPMAVAVGAGVLGAVIVIDRDGWIALFMAAVTVGDVALLPLLCVVLIPVWLAARVMPEMRVDPVPGGGPEFAAIPPESTVSRA